MSNYTKTTNFATKDNLSPGNPLKIVKGTEIDTEFNNIATAVATKTDNSAAAITGGAIDGATVGSTTPAAGAFTTLAASGTTTLAGALVGAATQAAFNTVSTTLNVGGAATAVNLGAATGTATVNNTTLAAKAITASTTLAVTGTSTLTGAVTATAGVTGPITSSSATITGGSITGITDLAVADGGTGASTAAGALNNLLPAQASAANKYLQSDGTNASWDAVSLSTADITGTLGVANGGTGVTSSTGSGNVVLSTSPTLVTPALGTPASGVATNLTGLPISTGVSGLGTGVATLLATPSSANLASAITDETGSGSLVFATSPTLVTPILGTPTSGTLTNATGLPISTGVSGLGTGVATFLATPSSANLAAALTDETGSGANVFATSPTLVTPILGTPTSATLTNATGLPLSTGVTGTLPVANGGTGTATPSIVAGTNVTVTGTWPNQTIAASGGSTSPGGSTTQVQYNNAGAFGGITGATTNGTALTLVAPVLGTPASATLTNATGLPLSTGVTGTLPVANGGTGQTTYTDGQLLIGNSTGNTLTKATLTAGTNVTITNAAGAITIAASGGGASAATPTALGTVYGAMDTGAYGQAFIGYGAGGSNTTSAANNTAMGNEALYSNTAGTHNSAFGFKALWSTATGGEENSAFGSLALYANTTGDSNVAVGRQALRFNTTASNNTAVGFEALKANTTANNNTALGYLAGAGGTTGPSNVFVGNNCGANYTTGQSNVGVGAGDVGQWNPALWSLTSGTNNCAVGAGALNSVTSGSFCTALGNGANALGTGNSNTVIGYNVGLAASGDTGEIVIGSNSAVGKGSSTGFINPNSGGVYQGNNSANWSTTSDRRLKKNIVDNNTGLEKLTQIQVRNFEYRVAEEITELPKNQVIEKSGVQLGVIAQELQAVLPDCVKTESTGVMTVDQDNLTWYMINAIKELKAEIDQLKGNV